MNYLLSGEYKKKWMDLTDKDLIKLQDTLVDKINSSTNSPAVVKSITEVLEILESYMSERDIF